MPVRSLHFTGGIELPSGAREEEPATAVNVLEVYANCVRDVSTASDKLRKLLLSENRHGDLQVSLSALRRATTAVEALIAIEEGA
jgi:hypothetical protein